MASQTKHMIRSSFMKLLNERPLSKITVKDITDDCGINRNSFYYHYQDIPSLIQEVLTDEVDRLIQQYPSIDNLEDCYCAAVSFAAENKRAILHIYNSVNRDIFEQYLWQACAQTVKIYFNTLFSSVKLRDEDRDAIIYYQVCEAFGVVSGWLSSGMRTDLNNFVHKMCELRLGTFARMVERAAGHGQQ